jgi:hypothetical protein
MGTELQQIGRNTYDAKKPVELTGPVAGESLLSFISISIRINLLDQIRILPGYQTEISMKKFGNEVKLVVNVDTMSKVISQKNALSIIFDANNRQQGKISNPSIISAIKLKLVGNTVFTSYPILPYFSLLLLLFVIFSYSLAITTLLMSLKVLTLLKTHLILLK